MSNGSGDVRHISESLHSVLEQHSLSAQSIKPSVCWREEVVVSGQQNERRRTKFSGLKGWDTESKMRNKSG